MKYSSLLYFFTLISYIANAQIATVEVLENTNSKIELAFSLGELRYETVTHREGVFTQINAAGMTKSYDLGNPDLPVYSKLIEVPAEGEIEITMLSKTNQIIDLASLGYHHEVFPSQASVFKNEDVNKIQFLYNSSVYNSDELYNQAIVKIERLGVMRGKHIARLQIAPLAYKPLSNSLTTINELSFELKFETPISSSSKAYNSLDFRSNFSKLINNDISSKNDFTTEPIRMIILSDPMFETELQAYIAWKRRKGFEVIEAYKGEAGVGSTFEEMKSYVQSFYDNATADEPAPTYLLIVGDDEQIPSYNTGSHVSDMYYVEFDGDNDFFPEMFVGRFSASTLSELIPQLVKTMEYEQYIMADPSYLGEALMVAGVDASFAPTHGNGQINYGNDYYFNADHGIETHTYLYPTSGTSTAQNEIIEHISEGIGFGNYTAHCGPTGWSDPSFDIYDVESLENEGEYGLLIGNCCQSNTFNGTTCLGEALLRGQKKGAIGYIGGSNNTLWDEDYYWGVGNGPVSANPLYAETSAAAYDCSFHENGELEEEWSITQGQILQAGNWAVTESGSGNIQYYWEIYHLMGDPSVLTYYGVPSMLTISHPAAVLLGSNSMTINTEKYTYVALNQGGELLDASYSDALGNVTLTYSSLTSMDPIEIVASKQNKQVYIEDINMMSSNAPFVSATSVQINNSSTGAFEAGETYTVDVNLQNYGLVGAEGVTVSVSSNTTNVTVVSNNNQNLTVGADTGVLVSNVATVTLNGVFEDQENVILTFTITDESGEVWESNISVTVYAPELEFTAHVVNDTDASGVIDFGESANLIFTLENTGHADCLEGLVTVSTEFEFLTIVEDEISFAAIGTQGEVQVSVPVILSENAPQAETYDVLLQAISEDGYVANYAMSLTTSNCLAGAMEVMLVLATDYYAGETGWSMTNSAGETLGYAEIGSLDSEQTYEEVFCMENNSYLTFQIEDSYGDGIFTEGYSIIVCDEIVASGASFGDGETISFIAGCDQSLTVGCTNQWSSNYDENAVVDDGSCLEVGLTELNNILHVYPNPATNKIKIEVGSQQIKTVSLMQMEGKEILTASVADSKIELNIESLNSGYYLIKIVLENGQSISKPIVVM